MKRSGSLKRKTPLRAKKAWNPERKPLNKVSPKRKKTYKQWRTGNTKMSAADWSKQRKVIYEEQGHRCKKCGRLIERIRDMHAHHEIHRSLGGGDQRENIVGWCSDCHMEEHNQGWSKGELHWRTKGSSSS